MRKSRFCRLNSKSVKKEEKKMVPRQLNQQKIPLSFLLPVINLGFFLTCVQAPVHPSYLRHWSLPYLPGNCPHNNQNRTKHTMQCGCVRQHQRAYELLGNSGQGRGRILGRPGLQTSYPFGRDCTLMSSNGRTW